MRKHADYCDSHTNWNGKTMACSCFLRYESDVQHRDEQDLDQTYDKAELDAAIERMKTVYEPDLVVEFDASDITYDTVTMKDTYEVRLFINGEEVRTPFETKPDAPVMDAHDANCHFYRWDTTIGCNCKPRHGVFERAIPPEENKRLMEEFEAEEPGLRITRDGDAPKLNLHQNGLLPETIQIYGRIKSMVWDGEKTTLTTEQPNILIPAARTSPFPGNTDPVDDGNTTSEVPWEGFDLNSTWTTAADTGYDHTFEGWRKAKGRTGNPYMGDLNDWIDSLRNEDDE